MPEKATYQHVHVGTGALGLGLVAWLGSRAGLSVFLANRSTGSSDSSLARSHLLRETHQYDVILPDPQAPPESVTFTELLFTDRDYDRFIAVVADRKTILLTTALKDGVEPSIPLLAKAVAARVETAAQDPLYIIACENTLDSTKLSEAIRSSLPSGIDRSKLERTVIFVPCMVDRLCNEPRLNPETRRVQVKVEKFAQWILESLSRDPSPLEQALKKPRTRDYIDFVTNLAPFVRRKRWLVNGPHLLIALNASADRYERLDMYLQTMPSADQLLAALLEEAMESFLAADRYFEPDKLREFNEHTRARFRDYPDLVGRILSRFTGPEQLHEFFKDFHRKVTEPAFEYIQWNQMPPPWTSHTLFLTTRLIANRRYVLRDPR